MTIEQIQALSAEHALIFYRAFSEEVYSAGWMAGQDKPPFGQFVKWLLSMPPPDQGASYETEFAKAWDAWRFASRTSKPKQVKEQMKASELQKPRPCALGAAGESPCPGTAI